MEGSAATVLESGAPPPMGKYIPFARLGNGGMADVFLSVARGPAGFNKLAVLKRLRNAGDEAHVRMFLDEARLCARLSHPNIVNTYEVGEVNRNYFIAMEYLEGQPLEALLTWVRTRPQALSEPLVAFIAIQTLKALHYAHELADYDGSALGIVHRDVSPHNLFLTYGGEVKLLDFGIAKAAVNVTQTETGVLKGKVRYMAPEQLGEKNIDRRVDTFAFGIVLWEMLAQRRLYEGSSFSVIQRISGEDAPSVRSVQPAVSPELDAIVTRALRRPREERYATAQEMGADLEKFLRGKKEEGSDAQLARLMTEAFTETRDTVRARIKSYLAKMPSADSGEISTSGLVQPAELLPPLLGDGSGPKPWPATTGASLRPSDTSTKTDANRPVPRGRSRPVIGVAVLLAAVALAVVALRSKPAAQPVAPASAVAPVATTVHLRITTTPPGALVEWNGKPVDRTPADITIDPGAQTLLLTREGFEPETLAIDAKAGTTVDRVLALRAKAAPAPAASATAPVPSVAIAPAPRRAPSRQASAPTAPAAPSASAARLKIRVLDDSESP